MKMTEKNYKAHIKHYTQEKVKVLPPRLGTRKGYPLLPLLVLEVLAINIGEERDIKGIQIENYPDIKNIQSQSMIIYR